MTTITSTANPRIKDIRKLRDRKHRSESGLAWVEGLRAIGDAFIHLENIQTVVVAPDLLHSDFASQLLNTASASGIDILEISREVFSAISGKENPQGIGAVIQQTFRSLASLEIQSNDLWVALDRVADPGNLGTIMRTLDACGGRGCFLLDNSTDPYDTTAIRASTGAIFHLELVKTDSTNFAEWKRSANVRMSGAIAVPGAEDYHSHIYANPLILMMGSEREGLSTLLTNLCDSLVFIPMTGHVDSLNLAEATAIVLYEIFNQRRENNRTTGVRR